MANVPFGGWANNPAQGGKNMRYWGGDVWTSGEDPTQGLGPNWQSILAQRTSTTPSTAGTMQGAEATAESDRQAFLKSQEEGRLAEQARLKAEEEGLMGQFQTQVAGQKPLTAAYEEYAGEAGVPGLTTQLGTVRTEVARVSDLIDRLSEDITARTSGKLVSESQRRRMVAAEQEPLGTELGRLTTGQATAAQQLQDAYQAVATKLGYLGAEQAKALEPIKARISAFSERAAREITAFTTQQTTALSLLLDKITAGRTIAQKEWEQASALATAERLYEEQRSQLELKAALDLKNKTSTSGTLAGGSLTFEQFKNLFTGGGTTTTTGGAGTDWQKQMDLIFGTTPEAGSSAKLIG